MKGRARACVLLCACACTFYVMLSKTNIRTINMKQRIEVVNTTVRMNFSAANQSAKSATGATTSSIATNATNATNKDAPLPRILCWVMCDPLDLELRVRHIKATWAKYCDVTLYMSSVSNDSFPTIGLDVPSGRTHIGIKSRKAWTYIREHYLDAADYFVKTDPDTFLVVPNLKLYLSGRDPNKAEFFGHRLRLQYQKWLVYNSGGPGQVLSKEALRRMVDIAFKQTGEECMPDGQGEDHKTARCLHLVGAHIVDTRDSQGRETFMIFTIERQISGAFPKWYFEMDVDGSLKGNDCCSDRPISFHYVDPKKMYALNYLFYRVKQVGTHAAEVSFIKNGYSINGTEHS